MSKKRRELNVQIKEYNNKSRKGTYIYIKEKGKPPKIWKYYEGTAIDGYVERYIKPQKKESYKPKKGKKRLTPKEYYEKVSKRPSISKILKKGETEVQIHDITKWNRLKEIDHRRKLLGRLIADKQIKEIMTQDINFSKLINRLEHKIFVMDTNNQEIMRFSIMGRPTNKVIYELQKTLKKGMRIRDEGSAGITGRLEHMGYKYFKWNKEIGTIGRIRIKTTLTKG